jgi:2-hydroxychromene-2-carboxylate isomerase
VHPAHWPADPKPSSFAILRAKATGRDVGPLILAVLRGVWAEERNLADPAVVAEVLKAEGFDPALAEGDPAGVDAAAEYARLTGEALEDGVFGAPFFVTEDGERFWGQDRLDLLDRHLAETAGA